MSRPFIPALMLSATLALAACESAEDKAERYYQSGLALMEQGDVDRALIELRNVFDYDGFHQEARRLYADTLAERGEMGEATGQYLRLIEQYPDDTEVRIILAEFALSRGDWAEAERHGTAAAEQDAQNPSVRAVQAALAYRDAQRDSDSEALAAALDSARSVIADQPENLVARRIVIDSLLNGRTPTAALPEIDDLLEYYPDDLGFHFIKFRVLAGSEQVEPAEDQLEMMFERFPENPDVRQTLVRWYIARGDLEGTERLLRELAGDITGEPDGHVAVVQFLSQSQGPEAATAELDALIAANEGQDASDLYRALRASIQFEQGEPDAAITEMRAIVGAAEPTDQTHRIQVILARMLISNEDPVGARALVEEVLVQDAANVDALKLRSIWLIEDDDPDAALVDLRTALGEAPRDPEIATLLAQAYQRAGQAELAAEQLARAVEFSNGAPEESLRYAQYLLQDGRSNLAVQVLEDSRRLNPTNFDVLRQLGEIWLTQRDFPRLVELRETLLAINTAQSIRYAEELQAAILLSQNRSEEAIALLENQLVDTEDSTTTGVTIVLTQIRLGNIEEARNRLDGLLEADPENPSLRLLLGSMLLLEEDFAGAEAQYREVMADEPQAEEPVRLLFELLLIQGRSDEARALIEQAVEDQPDAERLPWVLASILEQEGNVDGAIAVYERMYERDSSNLIVANNLASLITTYRDDQESLERAFAIARRLRGLDQPAFQDTYGWIESRLGNYEDALRSLEPAARGLPDNALVHYHLGMTYAALERADEAVASLERALELGGEADIPQMQTARETLTAMQALAATQTEDAPAE